MGEPGIIDTLNALVLETEVKLLSSMTWRRLYAVGDLIQTGTHLG